MEPGDAEGLGEVAGAGMRIQPPRRHLHDDAAREPPGGERLQDLLANDLYHLVRMYRCQFGMTGPRAPTALREHAQIVDAIAARDGEWAEVLMRRHIRASRRQVEKRLSGELATPPPLTH